MFFIIEKKYFRNLKRIRRFNDTCYNKKRINKYDNKEITDDLSKLIKPIKEKFNILRESIINDLRFTNFEIGMASIRPRGYKFNSYFWIWLVNKQEYLKLKKEGVESPQLSLPQVQISISPSSFVTAEIWFEKQSFDKRVKLYNIIKKTKNLELLKKEYDFEVLIDTKRIYNKLATYEDNSFRSVFNNFNNKKFHEAGIKKSIPINEAVNIGVELIDTIKNDLSDMIKNVYEPVYGKILNRSIDNLLSNNRLRNEGSVLRKGTGEIKYERKHSRMQNVFKAYYVKEGCEVHLEKKRIDAILIRGKELEIIEMKPYDNVIKTLRESLGQIISYFYIFDKSIKKKISLVVAGLGKPSTKDLKFINYLKNNISFDFQYLYFDYRKKNIRAKYF